jgi:hypothetical protein
LADGSFEWEKEMDDENLGSSVTYNVAPGNITFSLRQAAPQDPRWTWAERGTTTGGNWAQVTEITITYNSSAEIYLVLQDNQGYKNDGRGYEYALTTSSTDKTVTIPITNFKRYNEDWDDDKISLTLGELNIFSGVAITPADENVTAAGAIKSLKVKGLVFDDDGGNGGNGNGGNGGSPITPHKIAQKAINGANVSVSNGKLNLSLPTTANSANIVLFDLRGRVLFERNIAISANVASVALPKNISRNQAAILQIRTNSGFNLTKRVLIK